MQKCACKLVSIKGTILDTVLSCSPKTFFLDMPNVHLCCLFLSDILDIVKDQISASDYRREEDPRLFVSQKTGRGPLSENWREEYVQASSGCSATNKSIMCAYKLCKVEFRYWGMQSKIERFIHDVG